MRGQRRPAPDAGLRDWPAPLLLVAAAIAVALHLAGMTPAMLATFAPELALLLAASLALLALPAAWRISMSARRFLAATPTREA